LLVAGGAKAANLGTAVTPDCFDFAPANFTGVAGDTFTMRKSSGAACVLSFTVSNGAILQLSGSALAVGTDITVTILATGTAFVSYAGPRISVSPPAPTVSLSTASLSINVTTLTIAGTNFDTTAGNNTVVFNLGAAGTVAAATATQLTVTLNTPPTSIGSLTAVVTTNGQSSGSAVQVATVVSAPTAKAIPSLSEWTQLLLALITIMLVVWHFHRERSY
jgi:hypothetical protein